LTDLGQHVPGAGWDCRACGSLWPCDPARRRLAEESFDMATLSVLMWVYFDDYVREIGPGPVIEAYDRFLAAYGRFLGWIRPAMEEARRDRP
jgi:hypothetical protein